MDISKLSKEEKAELLRKLKEEEKTESIRHTISRVWHPVHRESCQADPVIH